MTHTSIDQNGARIISAFQCFIVLTSIILWSAGCNFLNDPPEELAILSVSPNPFSDTVKVIYSVVSETSFERLRIVVTDRNRTVIKTLVDETPKNGIYTIRWNGKKLKGGFYYIEMLGWFDDIAMSKILIFREGDE